MAALWLHCVSLLAVLLVSWPGCQAAAQPQYLCGTDIVDALSLVCGDRGFMFNPKRDVNPLTGFLTPKMVAASKRNILEQCCFQSCNIFDLEEYCI
ncbi:insulin-like [Sander lucioperca]|uniref:Insulin n=1 Tax=Sander lucioperca TaxID=283035 RepID=A0A8D0AB36_SANLU|nr:insulin-like [Sander lucioperca]XP_031169789.1 insulin-like [Sander lucioperca]